MLDKIKDLATNVNFCLKLAECIVCFVGMILPIVDISYYYGSVYGWFMVSFAFLVAYTFEKSNFGLEVIIILMFYMPMKDALYGLVYSISTFHLCPAITAILMLIDILFLMINRNK